MTGRDEIRERRAGIAPQPRGDVVSGQNASAGPLLTTYLAAGDRGDFPTMQSCLADEVVTHSTGGTDLSGFEALRRSWAAAHSGLSGLQHEVRGLWAEGESAAARIVVTGVHVGPFLGVAGTGSTLRVDQGLFVRVASGRIAEMWEVVDTGSALRQIGLLVGQPLSPGE